MRIVPTQPGFRAVALAVALGLFGCADGSAGAAGETESGTEGAGHDDTDTDGSEPVPSGPDVALDPSTMGPYPVGVVTVQLEDPDRIDEEGQPRPVVVEIWYPATDDALQAETVTYGLADVLRPEVYEDLASTGIEIALPTDAVRDAEPRASAGPFALVLFSHGSSGVRMQSTYLTVPLASHGYVVASADHYGNTLSDAILEGGQSSEMTLEAFENRPIDMTFLLDYMRSLPPGDPLAPLVDGSRVGVAGHSFGALTALRWMGRGADVDVVVAQASPGMDLTWLAVPGDLADFDTPIMLHVGGIDSTTPPAQSDSIWQEASPPRARLTLATGGHFTFSDMCLIDREALQAVAAAGVFNALDDGCSDDNVDAVSAFPVVRHYAIGYFNLHLRDSTPTADLLTEEAGQALLGDEVSFEIES